MAGQIPEQFILDLRHRTDIVDIIRDYVPLKKQGQNFIGICPFHAEKTPSFIVSPHKQIFHCFGCGKGGNVFSFLMEKNGLAFTEAVEVLANRYGLALPKKDLSPETIKRDTLRKRWFHINELAAKFYHRTLLGPAGEKALAYLRGRGLLPETIKKFNLGYATQDWEQLIRYLSEQGITAEELLEIGLASRTERGTQVDRFRQRVMFPITDDAGRCVGFGGRVLDDSLPKYLNSPETPLFSKGRQLYGLHLAKAEIRLRDQAVIMEGYMDVITAHQQGITNTVGALGTALTAEQARLLMRHTYNIAICFDSDPAGQEAAMRGLDVLQQLGSQVSVVVIPEGKDPDEYIKKVGGQGFAQLVKGAYPLLEYKFLKLAEKTDTSTAQGKTKVIQSLIPDIQKVLSPVARQSFIQMISDRLMIPDTTIHAEIRKRAAEASGQEREQKARPSGLNNYSALSKAERTMLRLVLERPELLAEVEKKGGQELFNEPILKEIYQGNYVIRQAGHNIKADDLISLFDKVEIQQLISQILLEEEISQEGERLFKDCLTILRIEYLNKKINEKSNQMSQSEKVGEVSKAVEIMTQIQELLKEKQNLSASLRRGGNE